MDQLMNQKRVQPPQQEKQKQRWWVKRGMKICAGFLVMAVLLVLSYITAVAIAIGPVTAYRMLTNLDSNIYTYKIFPQRAVATGVSVSALKQASLANVPTTINFSYNGSHYTTRLNDLFAQTDTQAFIVIRNNTVIYEKYLNGAHRDTLFTSFSMAKSVTSALIGIAIDEGKIKSVLDPVIRYVPELKGRGFDRLTIRDMLHMSTGVTFQHDNGLFLPLLPFLSDDARQYYTTNLRQLILSVRRSDQPIGAGFHYNDFYSLLEGLILERVTGKTVTQYTQDKLWQPMGMEYPASWSLDSTADGFEKTNSALNARAIDFARFGLMFLNQGRWNGQQIILTALGVDLEGNKEVLALYASAEESKEGWLSLLQDLRTRGATQLDLIVTDGHDGLLAAASDLFAATPRQRCLVHKQRNVLNAIPRRERGEVQAELVGIWHQATKAEALTQLAAFKAKYSKRYRGSGAKPG